MKGAPTGLQGADASMLDVVQAAWVAFARTGDPGDDWEPYRYGERVTRLDDPVELVDEIGTGGARPSTN